MLQPNNDNEKKKKQKKKKEDNQDNLGLFTINSISYFHLFLIATLISAVGMNAKPKIIDLTKQFGTVETLTEARVNCSLEDKVCLFVFYQIL